MLDLSEKEFIVVVINMFTELKKSMIKEETEGLITSHQIENINKKYSEPRAGM